MRLLPSGLMSFCSLLASVPAQSPTHGDMVGSVAPRSAIVWTRSARDADVGVVLATRLDFRDARGFGPVKATPATDFCAKVPLTGLAPATHYYYATRHLDRLTQVEVFGQVGEFSTPPDPGTPQAVTFAYSADIKTHSEYDIFDRILAQQPEFFVSLGDFPYCEDANTLDEYRSHYKLSRNDATIQRFFHRLPMYGVWDDHEVENDWDASTGAANERDGITAWFEYMPVPDQPREIYGSRRWGQLLELFLLDTRSHRDANSAPDLPGKTMLGQQQKEWLKAALRSSTATFKVVATSVPLRFGRPNKDHWNGFMRERRELLDWIGSEHVQNVVFLSGDSHFVSIHHHREGVREYQVGPLAQAVGVGSARLDPEVRFRVYERSFGLIRIDAGPVPKLNLEVHGKNGLLYRETLEAQVPAALEVTSDVPEAQFHLQGPTLVRNSGARLRVPRIDPGDYRAVFTSNVAVDGIPADLLLNVPGGSEVRIGTRWRDRAPPANPVLLQDTFEALQHQFLVVDEGRLEGPSAWFYDNGYLRQNSNIHDGRSAVDPSRLGTVAIAGKSTWTDYTLHAMARSEDDDAFGVILRWQDPENYYRFSWDSESRSRRLVVKHGGLFTVLAEDNVVYESDRWYELRCSAVGNRLKVVIDGTTVFDVRDNSIAAGAAGFYTCQNSLTSFDDFVVRAGDTTDWRNPRLFADDFEDGRVTGWTISDQGTVNAPSRWVEWGSHFIQSSAISDGQTNNDLPMRGTMAVAGQGTWTDYTLRAQLRNLDVGPIGLVFRVAGPDTYYRFLYDSRRQIRRLTKVVRGRWSLLHEDAVPTTQGRSYEVLVETRGSQLRVLVDGQIFADVVDTEIPAGAVGVYCASSVGALFDEFVVERSLPQRAVLAAVWNGAGSQLLGRSPAGAGQPYQLMLALERVPSIPLSLVDPLDLRSLELAPDALFFASLNLNLPGFLGTVGANGNFSAQVQLPVIGALSGRSFYCGGLVLDRLPGRVLEVVPTVELRFP